MFKINLHLFSIKSSLLPDPLSLECRLGFPFSSVFDDAVDDLSLPLAVPLVDKFLFSGPVLTGLPSFVLFVVLSAEGLVGVLALFIFCIILTSPIFVTRSRLPVDDFNFVVKPSRIT